MKKKNKYCRACGYLEILKKTDSFDIDTGKPVYDYFCDNHKCRYYCVNNGGHHYSFWLGICKNCGCKSEY